MLEVNKRSARSRELVLFKKPVVVVTVVVVILEKLELALELLPRSDL